MPQFKSREVAVAVDMAGCPNRCRHCWLGHLCGPIILGRVGGPPEAEAVGLKKQSPTGWPAPLRGLGALSAAALAPRDKRRPLAPGFIGQHRLGNPPNRPVPVETLRRVVEQFRRWVRPGERRPFIEKLSAHTWYREPDYAANYRELWGLEKERGTRAGGLLPGGSSITNKTQPGECPPHRGGLPPWGDRLPIVSAHQGFVRRCKAPGLVTGGASDTPAPAKPRLGPEGGRRFLGTGVCGGHTPHVRRRRNTSAAPHKS